MEVCQNVEMLLFHWIGIGCPKVVRCDRGTENCKLAKVHIAFRMNHNDSLSGSKSFIYGTSTANTVSQGQ